MINDAINLAKQNKLWLILGIAAIAGVCLYASFKLAKRYKAYQATLPRSDADYYLQVGNLKRAYDLHVPVSYTGKKPVPLMIALHGVGGDGKSMQAQTGFNPVADREGFIVVYPDGVSHHWNSRRGGKPDTTNDVGFISALIDDLGTRYQIDRSRIYATGFSNGGTFTHRLGCELSDKIAAIAVVAAPIPAYLTTTCKTAQPISVLLIHGTKDEAFPYETGAKGVLSVPDTFKYWGKHNHCSPSVSTKLLPTVSGVNVSTYQQCPGQTSVVLYTIEGGGHDWAGIHPASAHKDSSTHSFSPSEVIWQFFN